MNKPTDKFWTLAGWALIIFCFFLGLALITWASGGK